MSTIAEWLASLGLSEYAQRFADNSIDDISILRDLTDQDLKDIGVPLGHRRKMLRAIAELAGTAPTMHPPAVATPAVPQDAAERRQITVMLCDLVGTTGMCLTEVVDLVNDLPSFVIQLSLDEARKLKDELEKHECATSEIRENWAQQQCR